MGSRALAAWRGFAGEDTETGLLVRSGWKGVPADEQHRGTPPTHGAAFWLWRSEPGLGSLLLFPVALTKAESQACSSGAPSQTPLACLKVTLGGSQEQRGAPEPAGGGFELNNKFPGAECQAGGCRAFRLDSCWALSERPTLHPGEWGMKGMQIGILLLRRWLIPKALEVGC